MLCVIGGGGTDKYKAQGPASMPHLWPPMASPKGTPRVHQCHWQCTKRSSLQPMPMLITTPSPGQLPWCTRQYHHKACSKTGLDWPGTIPTCNDHGPMPCPKQAGCNTKGITKQKVHAPEHFSSKQGQAPGGSPNINQPFSTTKMGVAGPADCALATLVRVNDFLERIPPIKANPVGEGRGPFHRLRK